MKTSLSIAHVLSDLEAQLAHHEGQEAFHAQQEVFHREQRILHAEKVGKVRERYEAFKAGVVAAGEIFADLPQAAPAPPVPSAPPPLIPSEGDDGGRRPTVAKLVLHLVAAKAGNETFTPSSVAAELNTRYAARMRRPLDGRDASVYLRRLLAEGDLRLVRKGGAAHEAVYTRRLD